MSAQDYSVAVRLQLVENVSKGLLAMGAQFSRLNQQSAIFQARLRSLRSQIAVGAGMVGFGSAIAAPLIMAANAAGKLQQQLMFVQKATHASNLEMETFRGTVEKAAGVSGFTSIDVGTMAKTLATGFQLPIDQISKFLPMFSQYAKNQQMFKGTNPQEAVMQGLQLAHLGGHTDYESVKKDLDLLTQLNYIMPGNITKVLQAQKYAQGTLGNIMGVSQKDTLLLIATLDRFGINGTRAGSSLLSAVARSVPGVMWSGLLPGQSAISLAKMGLTDQSGKPKFFNKEGKFDVQTWMNTLNTFVKNERATKDPATASAEIMKAFQFSMGTTGTRLAAVLSSDTGMREFEELKKSLASMPVLSEQTKNLQGLLSFQQIRFWNDLKNVFTEMGYATLPVLTGLLSGFSDKLESLTAFMQTHPLLTGRIEEAILSIAGLSIVGGILVMLRAGLMGLLIPFQMLNVLIPIVTKGLTAFAVLLTPLSVFIAGVSSAVGLFVYGAYQAWQTLKSINWSNLGMEFQYLWDTIYNGITNLISKLINKLEFWKSNPATTALNLLKIPVEAIQNRLPNYLAHPITAAQNVLPSYLAHPLNTVSNTFNSVIHHGQNNNVNVADQKSHQTQPIHVQINMDGRKVAHAVATHIYSGSSQMPNSSSQFDTNLSPMPSIANAIGIG